MSVRVFGYIVIIDKILDISLQSLYLLNTLNFWTAINISNVSEKFANTKTEETK